ncbi:GDSL-like Lipase/Acylhydrolase [Gimesia panareensis]|uniref:GDSL-like Lipase/Acylhydrolase n=1 Tax=Gimesia panareensis TaxID=2527978 RepID=A0A518FHH0_9PLAN|nr:SGNH/GDSL hydrolase family protein [Gimesia panareensis]QDV15798.1 GDSL-like Lipase/Acylhydrolase [Gimesia panareensis]
MKYLKIRSQLIGLVAVCLLLQMTTLLSAQEAKQQTHKAPLSKMELKTGDSIVFLGDSITHQCLYTQYVEDFFYTRYPKMRLKFHNAGVGGAKAWDALARFDRDVAAYHPKYVTVLLGMNDGRYQPFNDEIFLTYYEDMKELISKIEGIGATPILMTPTMFDARAARLGKRKRDPAAVELYNSVLAYYGTWLREVAAESGFGFVDMYSPLNNITITERQKNPQFTLIRDAIHPDPPGQVVMAVALLSDMNVQRQVSRVTISKKANGEPAMAARGGKLSDLKYTDDGVTFTWLADSLPWVVPEEAKLGAELTKLGHRMSQESLSIHDLPPGRYELSIDGQVVGQYANTALARHVELQGNPKTPQYQQAMKVALLNQERNAGPVKDKRNSWRAFQSYARLKREVDAQGDQKDEKKVAQVAQLDKRLEDQDRVIQESEAAAKALEDKIYEVNQPVARKYVLKKVTAAKKK